MLSSAQDNGLAVDLVGLAFVAAALAWLVVTAAASGGEPQPAVGLLLAGAAAYVLGRIFGERFRWLIPLAAVLFVVLLTARYWGDLVPNRPVSGPLEYGNANAALYLQGTVAALMLAVTWRSKAAQIMALTAATALAVVTLIADSVAVDVLLLLAAAALLTRRGVRALVLVFVGLVAIAVLTSTLLGLLWRGSEPGGPAGRAVKRALSDRRPALWHDALVLMGAHPVTGVGPGRFQVTSPTALSDDDARWAHNEFLQQGAEGGIPGLVLILLLIAWGFATLLVVPQPDRVTALGAAALAALAIQSCVDYVLHFPMLGAMAAALVGVASARGRWTVQIGGAIRR